MVELGCLLSSYGFTAIVGSNPTPSAIYYAPVAQWIRASDYGSEGRGFESSRALNDTRFRSRGFLAAGLEVRLWDNCPVSIFCNVGSVLDA